MRRLRGVLTGYLTLVVLGVLVETGPASRLSGLAGDLVKLMRRGLDPKVAAVPDRSAGGGGPPDVSQMPAPGSPDLPADAGPAPKCPPRSTPLWDPSQHKWVCVGSDVVPAPGAGQPSAPGGQYFSTVRG